MRLAVIAAAAAAASWLGAMKPWGCWERSSSLYQLQPTGDSGRGNGADGMQSVQMVWDILGSGSMGRSGVKDTLVCIRDKRQ